MQPRTLFGNPALARLTAGFALATLAGVFFGLIGPFGLYLTGSAPARIAYAVGTFWIGSLLFGVAIPAVQRWAVAASVPVWLWTPVTVVLLAVPVAAVSRVAALMLWPWLADHVGPLEWFGQSLIVCAAALAAATVITRAFDRPRPAPTVAPSIPPDRGVSGLGPDVLCLQMEDHYVRVHRPSGSDLVLMSMGQAIEAMGRRDGLRVHRSWWVARDAVEAAVPDGRQWRLRLRGGLEAPVSRPNVARLRQAGWI